MGSDPVVQVARPGGFGIGVAARAQHGHEDRRLTALSAVWIYDCNGRAGVIDIELLAGAMFLTQDDVKPLFPVAVKLTEATVLISLGMGLLVFLPQQRKCQVPMTAQFLVDPRKIRERCSTHLAVRRRGE